MGDEVMAQSWQASMCDRCQNKGHKQAECRTAYRYETCWNIDKNKLVRNACQNNMVMAGTTLCQIARHDHVLTGTLTRDIGARVLHHRWQSRGVGFTL